MGWNIQVISITRLKPEKDGRNSTEVCMIDSYLHLLKRAGKAGEGPLRKGPERTVVQPLQHLGCLRLSPVSHKEVSAANPASEEKDEK
jgi:hypothetical protein